MILGKKSPAPSPWVLGFSPILLFLLIVITPALASADAERKVWRVGPQHDLKVPSAAARLARRGDIVEIEAGDYHGDVAVWNQSRLTLRGVNGRPHLHADGKDAEGKAIWVIKGNDVEVDNIEFSGCRTPARSGAGIRAEGAGLRITNSSFHHNQMGILTNNNPAGFLMIKGSEFHHNTVFAAHRPRIGHNIYVGKIQRFLLQDTDVYGADTGHQVKTRAKRNNIVGNRIRDGAGADSSYLIDIAEGGDAVIQSNELQQGARSSNRNAVSFAAEAGRDGGSLIVRDNRFVNDGSRGTFVNNHAATDAQLTGNDLLGSVTPLSGRGRVKP